VVVAVAARFPHVLLGTGVKYFAFFIYFTFLRFDVFYFINFLFLTNVVEGACEYWKFQREAILKTQHQNIIFVVN